MKRDPYDAIVRHALARYIGAPRVAIVGQHRLGPDLGLDAFDLALVALCVQGVVKREFPLALLDLVETVEELIGLVRAWAHHTETRRDHDPAAA